MEKKLTPQHKFYLEHVRFTDKNGNTVKPIFRDVDYEFLKALEESVNKKIPLLIIHKRPRP